MHRQPVAAAVVAAAIVAGAFVVGRATRPDPPAAPDQLAERIDVPKVKPSRWELPETKLPALAGPTATARPIETVIAEPTADPGSAEVQPPVTPVPPEPTPVPTEPPPEPEPEPTVEIVPDGED